MDDHTLLLEAFRAREQAYAPYSGFMVGAALLTSQGKLYLGCNIESAAYSPSICAERVALCKAISEGERDFAAIAVVGAPHNAKQDTFAFCYPCGVCRQMMLEFCNPSQFRVLAGKGPYEYESYLLRDLIPHSFGPQDLQPAQPPIQGE